MANQASNAGRLIWYVAEAIIIIAVVVGVNVIYNYGFPTTGAAPSPSTSGGGTHYDIYSAEYGFGTSSKGERSPGPTMTFKAGQTVTVTLHNEGALPHNWAAVIAKTDGNTNLAFSGAQIATADNPVKGGSSASVTFTVGSAGNYYYICQVDGHVSLGMWGNIVVNP